MAPYFVSLFLVSIFSLIAEQYKPTYETENGKLVSGNKTRYELFVFLATAVLILVSGLRYDVGTDYLSYSRAFLTRAARLKDDLKSFKEPGLDFIAWISSKFSRDYALFFFIVSVITVSLNVKTIKKYSDSICLGLMFYVLTGAWHNSFNGIRQYLAAAILFAGHRYMYERKFWKYLFVVFLATCFHTTALIMLPVYFLAGRKFTWKNILLIMISVVAIRFSYDYLFDIMNFLKGHDQSEYEYMKTEVNIMRVLVTVPPLIMAFATSKEIKDEPENAFYMSMLAVNAAFMFATANSAYLARVGIYTEVYIALAFPKFLKGYNLQTQKVISLSAIALYIIYWYYEISTRSSLNHFHWIFNR